MAMQIQAGGAVRLPARAVPPASRAVVDERPRIARLPALRDPGPALTEASPERSAAFLPRLLDGAREGIRSAVHGTVAFVRNLFDHREVWHNPALPSRPGDPGKLSVVSYNILLGGQRIEQAEQALRRLDADVVCLQEASLESAQRLARNLGYHLAFATTPLRPAGKAILSRYPIERLEDRPFESVPFLQRVGAYYRESVMNRQYDQTEPLAKRSILHAQLRVGDRIVDVLDNHLSLKNAQSNAEELQELAAYARKLARQGHTVIAAGDFNTNFALAGEGRVADAAGRLETPTDTIEEFAARYPRSIGGNVVAPADKAAVDRLAAELPNFWTAAPDRQVIVRGRTMTPEEALEELRSGAVPPGGARYLELLKAADGITHLGANKRFDNIFVSRDARIQRALIDQTSKGSDHQPVLAEIAW